MYHSQKAMTLCIMVQSNASTVHLYNTDFFYTKIGDGVVKENEQVIV